MCEFIAPKVFEVTDVSHIKPDFDQQENDALIEQSVKECPVFVIKYEEKEWFCKKYRMVESQFDFFVNIEYTFYILWLLNKRI